MSKMVFTITATLLRIRKKHVILKDNGLKIIFLFIICSIWLLLTSNKSIEFWKMQSTAMNLVLSRNSQFAITKGCELDFYSFFTTLSFAG